MFCIMGDFPIDYSLRASEGLCQGVRLHMWVMKKNSLEEALRASSPSINGLIGISDNRQKFIARRKFWMSKNWTGVRS